MINKLDDFYNSKPWRRLRSVALRLHGKRCACCGNEGTKYHPVHVDHIKPRSLFEHLSLDINNLQVLCEQCNTDKSNYHCTDYRTDDSIMRAKRYSENPKLLPALAYENAGIFVKTKQQRKEQSIADKIKHKEKNPKQKKVDTRSPAHKRKDQSDRLAMQVKFLDDINAVRHTGNVNDVIDEYISMYGVSVTTGLISRCNIRHLVGERTL